MAATQTAVKEVIREVGGNFTLDDNVIKGTHELWHIFPFHGRRNAELHEGARVLQACSYGTAQWTRAARIDVLSADGTPSLFFLKVRGVARSCLNCG